MTMAMMINRSFLKHSCVCNNDNVKGEGTHGVGVVHNASCRRCCLGCCRLSGAVLTVYVKIGVGTDSMRTGEDTPYTDSTIIVYTVLYKPRIEVVIQEPPKISTTPAWHLTTRKTAENSDKGIADATAKQQPAECHHHRCSIHCRESPKDPRTWPEASRMSASL